MSNSTVVPSTLILRYSCAASTQDGENHEAINLLGSFCWKILAIKEVWGSEIYLHPHHLSGYRESSRRPNSATHTDVCYTHIHQWSLKSWHSPVSSMRFQLFSTLQVIQPHCGKCSQVADSSEAGVYASSLASFRNPPTPIAGQRTTQGSSQILGFPEGSPTVHTRVRSLFTVFLASPHILNTFSITNETSSLWIINAK